MTRRKLVIALLPVFTCFAAGMVIAQETKSLTIEADEWCPINCAKGSGQDGIGIELARRVFEPLGYRVNYIIAPWTKALSDVRSGKVDAVVGASTLDDASLVFPSSYLFDISDDFYVLNGNPWRYQGPYTLKDKRIGIVSGYGYGSVISQFIQENSSHRGQVQAVSGAEALPENIAKLRANQIDIIVESKPVMDYNLQKLGETQIIWAGGLHQAPVYLAFSPASSQSRTLAAQYDAGVKQLKASGEYDKIFRSYGLKP